MSATWHVTRSVMPARLKRLPPRPGIRASTITTSTSPISTSRRARLLPMKPRPPVISTERRWYGVRLGCIALMPETSRSLERRERGVREQQPGGVQQEPSHEDQRRPQGQKVEGRAGHPPEGEELGSPMTARIVVDGDFGEP